MRSGFPLNLLRSTVLHVALVCMLMALAAGIGNASDPTGVWRGQWTSNSTGHRGPMRVAIRPAGNGNYQARFSGRFFVVIPFMYRATLMPSTDAYGNTVLSANKQLGFGLGNYTMQTFISGNRLQGSFSAAGDRGKVNMIRVR